jgi:FixJ family two-component response regulator
MKVAIIDDNKEFLALFARTAPKHWHLSSYAKISDFIKEHPQHKNSVIISDIMMPSAPGTYFIELAKNLCPDASFVFISANPRGQIEEEMKKMVEKFKKERGGEVMSEILPLPKAANLYQKPLSDEFYEKIESLLKSK